MATPVAEPAPRFCSRCGSGLTVMRVHLGFDEFSGEPLFRSLLECPDARPDRDREAARSVTFEGTSFANPWWAGGLLRYIDCAPVEEAEA